VWRRYTACDPPALLRNCGCQIGPTRGAENAGRHAAKLAGARAVRRPAGARAAAGNVAEGAPKRTQTSPAGVEGDLGYRELRVAQQRRRPFDASRQQVPMWREAKRLLERAREVCRGDAAHARKPHDGPLLVRGGIHPILGAQQATRQLRGLMAGLCGARAGRLPGRIAAGPARLAGGRCRARQHNLWFCHRRYGIRFRSTGPKSMHGAR
jgi:hypothetical protein